MQDKLVRGDVGFRNSQVSVVIPAYKPGRRLVPLLDALGKQGYTSIIVVDDGSGPQYSDTFLEASDLPGVIVVRHAVNLGKGAALKTGINAAALRAPDGAGVVTADADGQHHPDDIRNVAERLLAVPHALILGARHFDRSVPLRSRFGNQLTRGLTRSVIGMRLADTQTGLRGIPKSLYEVLLRMPAAGYEFELDMLVAAHHHKYEVVEVPIQTIYLDGNQESHFDPIRDSMRIYFVLLRFGMLSLLTALVDNAVFIGAFALSGNVLASQALGRVGGVAVNYTLARKAVFLSGERHRILLPKYLALVVFSGAVSYALIRFFHSVGGLNVVPSKLTAEALLFIANFCIQRDLVFQRASKRDRSDRTDWDSYYQSVPPTAKLTRRYTTSVLLGYLRRYLPTPQPFITEIGGANSCFLDAVVADLSPARYEVIDNNAYGLNLLSDRKYSKTELSLSDRDVLTLADDPKADIVFSVGLVEHFDPERTRLAIASHFKLLKPGGLAIITFPTPTLLYRAARRVLEIFGMWKFHDERPLTRAEVAEAVQREGSILEEKTLWPLILTQGVIVARKRTAAQPSPTQDSPALTTSAIA